ncbi:MAG: radical SAM protein [Theionarchaea archaeon]|nr:MAG: hypothetical protein AYK19_11110 [Theionarchaea archaeon DG-70-1]MBU7028349.1 radical SAM protein [Theionarchaea archaeon]
MRGIFWEVTNKCNLRCKHCYLREELKSPSAEPAGELNTEECMKVVDQLEEASVFFVTVLGGEPFVRSDIMGILQYLGEKKFWTTIDTNGTLIGEDTARKLADIGIKGINVSLDGPDAGINDAIRGKGSLKKVICGINYLRDFGIPFHIAVTICKMNYTEIEKMADFSFQIGAETVKLGLYTDFPQNPLSSSMNLEREELFAVTKTIREIRTKFPKGFISSTFHESVGFFPPESEDAKNVLNSRFVRCGLGATQLVILHNGDVIPCTYMRDKILGNVMEIPLSTIPDTPEFAVFKKLREITIDEANEKCAACEWKYFCGGGCRGQAYLLYHDLLAPDPRKCLSFRGEVDD